MYGKKLKILAIFISAFMVVSNPGILSAHAAGTIGNGVRYALMLNEHNMHFDDKPIGTQLSTQNSSALNVWMINNASNAVYAIDDNVPDIIPAAPNSGTTTYSKTFSNKNVIKYNVGYKNIALYQNIPFDTLRAAGNGYWAIGLCMKIDKPAGSPHAAPTSNGNVDFKLLGDYSYVDPVDGTTKTKSSVNLIGKDNGSATGNVGVWDKYPVWGEYKHYISHRGFIGDTPVDTSKFFSYVDSNNITYTLKRAYLSLVVPVASFAEAPVDANGFITDDSYKTNAYVAACYITTGVYQGNGGIRYVNLDIAQKSEINNNWNCKDVGAPSSTSSFNVSYGSENKWCAGDNKSISYITTTEYENIARLSVTGNEASMYQSVPKERFTVGKKYKMSARVRLNSNGSYTNLNSADNQFIKLLTSDSYSERQYVISNTDFAFEDYDTWKEISSEPFELNETYGDTNPISYNSISHLIMAVGGSNFINTFNMGTDWNTEGNTTIDIDYFKIEEVDDLGNQITSYFASLDVINNDNTSPADFDVVLVVATYDNNALVNTKLLSKVVAPKTFDNFTLLISDTDLDNKVKVFVFDDISNITPLRDCVTYVEN